MTPAINFVGGLIVGAVAAIGVVALLLWGIVGFGNAMGARNRMNMKHMLDGFVKDLWQMQQYDALTPENKRVLNEIQQYCGRELEKWKK